MKEFRRVGVSKNEGWQDQAGTEGFPAGTVRRDRVSGTSSRARPTRALTVVIVQKEPETLPAPEAVKASKGEFRDKIDVTWDKVAGADTYLVRKWSERGKTWSLVVRSKTTSYTDVRPQDKQNLYSIIAVKGSLESEASAIAEGYLASAPEERGAQAVRRRRLQERLRQAGREILPERKVLQRRLLLPGRGHLLQQLRGGEFLLLRREGLLQIRRGKVLREGRRLLRREGKGRRFLRGRKETLTKIGP